MHSFMTFLHVLISIGLMVVILMQSPKGEGLSAMFGGQTAQFMNKQQGIEQWLFRGTVALGFLFVITSFVLSVWRV